MTTSIEQKLEGLTDQGFLDRAMRGEHGIPEHVICRSIWTFTYHKPSKRELSLRILYFTVARAKTPWWRIWRRMKLQAQINQIILEGVSHGYFNPKVKDTL